jgi:tetratricopeptide (TPR) repeat protein
MRSVAAALILTATFGARAFAQTGALPDDYRAIVNRYASGDHAGALAFLGAWDEARIERAIGTMHQVIGVLRRCAGCPERDAFARFPLRAAILLHGDREIQEQFGEPASEQLALCGVGRHARMIDELAAMLMLVDPDAGPFLKRFHLALSRYALWSLCLGEAERWARTGLRMYPKDALLWLAAGVPRDSGAFYGFNVAPRTPGMSPATLQQLDAHIDRRRMFLETARQAFEKALAIDPGLVEAKLRLGRTLWRLGQGPAARKHFEEILAKAQPWQFLYLAHLFLGRVLETGGLLAEAEAHYREALALLPVSETAAVALSHARLLQGDAEGAREILSAGLAAVQRRIDVDPWGGYYVIQTPEGEAILSELRAEISK